MKVSLEVTGGVGTVVLADPGGVNAVDLDGGRELARVIDAAVGDPAVRVVLLRGDGRAFCVGGDIGFFAASGDELHDRLLELFDAFHPAILRLHESHKLVVVAAHGAVAGGGMGLMSAADVVLLARSTKLTLAYHALGASPDAGVSWFLPRDVGYRRAMALYLSPDPIDAARALELGIASHVVDDDVLEEEARRVAERIAAGSPAGHAATKRLMRQALQTPLDRQLLDEALLFADNARTADFGAAVARFLGPH